MSQTLNKLRDFFKEKLFPNKKTVRKQDKETKNRKEEHNTHKFLRHILSSPQKFTEIYYFYLLFLASSHFHENICIPRKKHYSVFDYRLEYAERFSTTY